MSTINEELEKAFDLIDSEVFAGNAFDDEENLDMMKIHLGRWSQNLTPGQEKFTVEEFRKYVECQDSRGDIAYHLNAENIKKANVEPICDEEG